MIASLSREGGLPSVLWAGPDVIGRAVRRGEHPVQGTTRSGPVSLQLGFASDAFSYLIDLGLPQRMESSAFNLDPEIKRELVWVGEGMRPAHRAGEAHASPGAAPIACGRALRAGDRQLRTYESVLTELIDPRRRPS